MGESKAKMSCNSIYTTHIEKISSFIAIWGQMHKNVVDAIEKELLQLKPAFDDGVGLLAAEIIVEGMKCCVKYQNGKYYRACILSTSLLSKNLLDVILMDFGHRYYAKVGDIRSIYTFPSLNLSADAQASKFILANVQCNNENADDPIIGLIAKKIRYVTLSHEKVANIGEYTCIHIFNADGSRIEHDYFTKALLREISIEKQTFLMLRPENSFRTFAPRCLWVNSEHMVSVTCAPNGPINFSIQLESILSRRESLMAEISNTPLIPLAESPDLGIPCLAVDSATKRISRAVITCFVRNLYEVSFVDYGKTQICSLNELYRIPYKLVCPNMMSSRFSLAGLEHCVDNVAVAAAFQECVMNKKLKLRVLPPINAIALCALWTEDDHLILKQIEQSPLLDYPQSALESHSSGYNVQVTFVINWKKFFVQLRRNEKQLSCMMDDLQKAALVPASLKSLKVGSPCIARSPSTGLFLRGRVLQIKNTEVTVNFVDFGVEVALQITDIKAPLIEFIANIKPQAIECSLRGFEGDESDAQCDYVLNDLIMNEPLTMKVGEIVGSLHFVELFRENHENVATLLTEKCRQIAINNQTNDTFVTKYDDTVEKKTQARRQYGPKGRFSEEKTSEKRSNSNQNSTLQWGSVYERQTNAHEQKQFDFVDLKRRFKCENVKGKSQKVIISCYYSPTSFYCQLSDNINRFDEMMSAIEDAYKTRNKVEKAKVVRNAVIAKSNKRNALCRATVLNRKRGMCKLFFVDYGDVDETEEVYAIERRFMEMPARAVQCTILNINDRMAPLIPSRDAVAKYFEKDSFTCQFIDISDFSPSFIVDLIADGKSVNAELKKAGIVQSKEEERGENVESDREEDEGNEYERISMSSLDDETVIEVGKEGDDNEKAATQEQCSGPSERTMTLTVKLTHLNTPGDFYLVPSFDLTNSHNLQNILQMQIDTLHDIDVITIGMICAAPLSGRNNWYRAQVLDADSDNTRVRYIDIGNTAVLQSSIKLKILPIDLLAIEQYAKPCSLSLTPLQGQWSSTACEYFENITKRESQHLTARIVGQNCQKTFVQLFAGDLSINYSMFSNNLAQELHMECGIEAIGRVSHLDSPAAFWIQFEYAVSDLKSVAEQLCRCERFEPLTISTPGALCAALSPYDKIWYRARIRSITGNCIQAFFIDFGKTYTCTQFRELPEELLLLPPMAHKCSLVKPKGVLEWSPKSIQKFAMLAQDGGVFIITKQEQGDSNLVKMRWDDADMSTLIRPELLTVEISHYKSLHQFFVRRVSDEFRHMQRQIQDLRCRPDVDDELIAAYFDNAWYRARIVHVMSNNSRIVHLIDVGMEVKVYQMRKLPENLRKINAMAKRVDFQPLDGFIWNAASEAHFQSLMTLMSKQFQADLPHLYLHGVDVRAEIPCARRFMSSCPENETG